MPHSAPGVCRSGVVPYPTDSFLGPATARFLEQFPRVSVQLHTDDWDELVHMLRSRTLDFFVAEASLLAREPDLEIAPMPVRHPLYFFARAGHPLAQARASVRAADVMEWPFATPSRIPPRVLEPLLAAHREGSSRLAAAPPFPAIECSGLSPVKRLVAASNAVSASILPCIADELDSGRFALLATAPWLHLQYGLVSLRGRPWTQTAESLRELVFVAEREATQLERRLIAEHAPGVRARRARARRVARPARSPATARPAKG